MTQLIEKKKVIILTCFKKNVNMLLNKKKTSRFITDDIETSFDDSNRENSCKEISNEKN